MVLHVCCFKRFCLQNKCAMYTFLFHFVFITVELFEIGYKRNDDDNKINEITLGSLLLYCIDRYQLRIDGAYRLIDYLE